MLGELLRTASGRQLSIVRQDGKILQFFRYCKEGQGKNAREEQWRMHVPKSVDRVGCIGSYFSEPEITYTKLAVDPDGVPAFITGPVTNGVDCRQLGPAQRSCAVCNSRDVAVTSTRFLPCSVN